VKQALAPWWTTAAKDGDDRIVKTSNTSPAKRLQKWLANTSSSGIRGRHESAALCAADRSPERIPFDFGHMLDVEYLASASALDTPEGLLAIRLERHRLRDGPRPCEPAPGGLLGTAPHSRWTHASQLGELVKPLANANPASKPAPADLRSHREPLYRPLSRAPGFHQGQPALRVPSDGGGAAPAFLFTAGHGMGWPLTTRCKPPRPAPCWPGLPGRGLGPCSPPTIWPPLPAADARVHGPVAFHFACFARGVPLNDRYTHSRESRRARSRPRHSSSALPRHYCPNPTAVPGSNRPCGAGLGIVHRGRRRRSGQLMPFENVLGYVCSGCRSLCAEDFNDWSHPFPPPRDSAREPRISESRWPTATWPSAGPSATMPRQYTLLGDPGVRVRVDALQS